MKKLILLLVLGLLVVSCGKPSSTPVIETSPTEKIEEPTPTPVPPTATPVPPTPESTATPTPTPIPVSEYVGLPPDEVQRLREQCLRENPDSFCLPLSVDPTKSGVEVIFVHSDPSAFEDGMEFKTVVFKAPVGTIFLAPVAGEIPYWSGWNSRSMRPGELIVSGRAVLLFDEGKELSFPCSIGTRLAWVGFPDNYVSLGAHIFTIEEAGIQHESGWFDELEQPVSDYQVGLWIMVPKPAGGTICSLITEDDLLRDDQGRIVFIQP